MQGRHDPRNVPTVRPGVDQPALALHIASTRIGAVSLAQAKKTQ
jgi:hypothetical protein